MNKEKHRKLKPEAKENKTIAVEKVRKKPVYRFREYFIKMTCPKCRHRWSIQRVRQWRRVIPAWEKRLLKEGWAPRQINRLRIQAYQAKRGRKFLSLKLPRNKWR